MAKSSAQRQREYRARLGKMVGVGSGNAQGRGKDHHSYKNGTGTIPRHEIKDLIRYCEFCEKDLLDATSGYWVIHHKDHDHTNNDISNLQLLCKRCHQLEHNCIDNLQ